jgi:hypothetical protein
VGRIRRAPHRPRNQGWRGSHKEGLVYGYDDG